MEALRSPHESVPDRTAGQAAPSIGRSLPPISPGVLTAGRELTGATRRFTARHFAALAFLCVALPIWSFGMIGAGRPVGAGATSTPTSTPSATPSPTILYTYYAVPEPTPSPSPPPAPAAIIPTCGYRAASTAVQQYALSRVGQAEYNCLHAIAEQESHWNPLVINAASGACGIPQSVPCSKMVPGIPATSGAIDSATIAVYRAALSKVSANEQIAWMIRYVQGRGEYWRPFGKAHAFAVAAAIKFKTCIGVGASQTCTPGRGWY
jgi:hypothetical protein